MVTIVILAIIKFNSFTLNEVASSKISDTSQWSTVARVEYGFRIKHPKDLQIYETKGSSDLMGHFLSIDFGTMQEVDSLQRANDSTGVGGPALFLRLTVADASSNGDLLCGELNYLRDIRIDNEKGILCGGKTMISDQSMMAIVKHEGREFIFESGKYTEQDKNVIDAIVGSLEFTR